MFETEVAKKILESRRENLPSPAALSGGGAVKASGGAVKSSPKPSSSSSVPSSSSLSSSAPLHAGAVTSYDVDEIMKRLGTTRTEAGLLLTLLDYGGQSIFTCLHAFAIKRKTFFVLVFNMQWICSSDPVLEKSTLATLDNWLSMVNLEPCLLRSISLIHYSFSPSFSSSISFSSSTSSSSSSCSSSRFICRSLRTRTTMTRNLVPRS